MKKIANNIFLCDSSLPDLSQFLTPVVSSCFVLVDDNTFTHCLPLLANHLPMHSVIQIPAGEEHKSLSTCELIWEKLTAANADRRSLLINLGGGVVGDTGGFAAGCYKRGIKFINVPTTLLAMVDASVGGKTGIDFMCFKNQLGLFAQPEAVFVSSIFLNTLDFRELRSGFAEVIKHYLIADKEAFEQINSKRIPLKHFRFNEAIEKGISIKMGFVNPDPEEQNVRKALNFGHSIGHAVESHFFSAGNKRLLHGEAVAIGMIGEGYISWKKNLFSEAELQALTALIVHYFELPLIPESEHENILTLIKQDKKNVKDKNQFTLLQGIGNYSINNAVEEELIKASMNYYNSQFA